MRQSLVERIEYGRAIRDRAACLAEAHGRAAVAVARMAARTAGEAMGEQLFWEAVADRLERLRASPRWEPLFS